MQEAKYASRSHSHRQFATCKVRILVAPPFRTGVAPSPLTPPNQMRDNMQAWEEGYV